MAKLNIRKYVNQNQKQPNAYGKTYARLVALETLNTNDLCRHIAKHGTIFTSDVVKGVVEKFVNCFNELLLEGYKIKLDGLGTFYLSISTSGEANAEDFNTSNIKAVRIRFLGDKSKESDYTTRMLTARASFRNITTVPASSGDDDEENNSENQGSDNENQGSDDENQGSGNENQGNGNVTPVTPDPNDEENG